jgi:tubulin beta
MINIPKRLYFVEWIPTSGPPTVAPPQGPHGIRHLLQQLHRHPGGSRRVGQRLTSLLRRKAFLHGYTGEGVDESDMNDLVSKYQQYLGATPEDKETDEEERIICPCLFES